MTTDGAMCGARSGGVPDGVPDICSPGDVADVSARVRTTNREQEERRRHGTLIERLPCAETWCACTPRILLSKKRQDADIEINLQK